MNKRLQTRRPSGRERWCLGTRWRVVMAVVAAALWLPTVGGGGSSGIVMAQGGKGAPSKIAALVLDRISQIQAAQSAGTMSRAAAARLSSGSLAVTEDGQLEVEIHAARAVGAAESSALAGLGATILASTGDIRWPAGVSPPPTLGIIAVRMPADRIRDAAAFPWVVAVTPAEKQAPDVGAFISEGVVLHKTDQANTLGIDGAGVNVGVVSDGVSNLAAAQALGDLPPVVNVLNAGSDDEGTAMLEIIHDLAPGASLLFHGTGGGVANHITALNNLAAAGAQVIAEDIPFDAEPAFQKGAAATAAEALTVAGISVHSSAGNLGNQHAARLAAVGTAGGPDGFGGPFVGCPSNPDNVVAIAGAGDTTFDIQLASGASISATLQWSEPRAIFPTPGAGGFTDLDLYIMNAAASTCLASSTGTQGNGAGDTIEQANWTNPGPGTVTIKLVVDVSATDGAVATPLLDLRWRGGNAVDAVTRAGSLNPDSNYTFGATSAASADASVSTNPATIPIEPSSGGGPVQLISTTICMNGSYPCAGNATAGGPGQTVGAPTWTAADGVSVSGVGGFGRGNCPAVTQGDCRFFGTSAAAPHAAAIAALVRQALGSPTPLQITDAMATTARDRGTAGFDNVWGFGVLNALAAIGEEADLTVTKDCVPNVPLNAGQTATCTMIVRNNGPSTARTVVLSDVHLATATINWGTITTTQGTCSRVVNTITCALGDLASGATATVTASFSASQDLSASDVATVSSDTFDPDMSNNEASDSVEFVSSANLSITKSDAPDPVIAGENLTYTLTVMNGGPSPAVNVAVRDALSAQVSFQTASPSQGACQAGVVPGDPAKPLLCNLGTLASGASATILVVVRVNSVVPAGTLLVNNADVSSDTADPNTGNNVATASTTVQTRADLAIVKTSDALTYKPSSTVTYRIDVTNNGPSKALNVVVTDDLPATRQALYQSDTGGCVLSTPSRLTCNQGDLAVGETKTFFVYVVIKGNRGDVSNTASVTSATTDVILANNSSTRVVTIGHP
ncbi:MAG TPA: S8 family serine peptidase [Vicinamibacterales bacterium]|nr:S8 family serine peptidase [Vicinamibacterales bacterium]